MKYEDAARKATFGGTISPRPIRPGSSVRFEGVGLSDSGLAFGIAMNGIVHTLKDYQKDPLDTTKPIPSWELTEPAVIFNSLAAELDFRPPATASVKALRFVTLQEYRASHL